MSMGASASPTACLRSAWSQSALSPPKAAPACAVCGTAISKYGKSGKCVACAAKSRAPVRNHLPRVAQCVDCGVGITALARSGRCKPCATIIHNKLPDTRVKRVEGWKKRLSRPGELEKLQKQIRRNHEKALTDPEIYARLVERGKWLLENVIKTPEVQAKLKASRKRAGETLSQTRLGWCPERYRKLHHDNMEKHRMKAAQSREMIEALVAADELETRAARHPCFQNVIDYVRRNTAVFDLGPNKEKRYRVGLTDMSAGELLKRAEFNGYQYPHYPQVRSTFVPLAHESEDGKIAA